MNIRKKVNVVFKIVLILYLWVITYAYHRLMQTAPESQSEKGMYITVVSIICAVMGCIMLYLFKKYAIKYNDF